MKDHINRWRTVGVYLIGVICAGAVYAGVLPLPDSVPDGLPESLRQDRATLLDKAVALERRIQTHDASCSKVKPASAEAKKCAEENTGLQAAAVAYLDEMDRFNKSVKQAQEKLMADSPAKPVPVLVADSGVVDASNVPSGIEKSWEEHLNHLSAVPGVGDRLRKGWQAYQVNDFAVAAAWFEDALNHDPNNKGLQDFVRISRSAITGATANAQKLAVDPVYHAAIDQAVTAQAAGDVAAQKVATEKLRKAGGVLVLPKDSDLEFLYDLSDNGEEKIKRGDALPVADEKLNKLIKEHPELYQQLSALWKESCTYRIKAENDAMAKSVKELAGTAARLGLTYGHIDETVAKNPKLKAEWEKAIQTAAVEQQWKQFDAAIMGSRLFDLRFSELSRSVEPPKNPYNFYNQK